MGLNVHALMIGYIDQDGTERPVQRPQDAEQQKEHYSGKTDIPANTQQVAHLSRLLIVPTAHDPDPAIADYAKRWTIETLFRLGFDYLRHIIFDLHLNSQAFFNSIKFLSCT